MSASPWALPQTGSQPTAPVLPPPQATPTRPQTGPPPAGPPIPPVAPPPRPPRRGFPWLLAIGAVVVLIAAIAATAAITYAVARNTNAPTATLVPTPTAQAPQFSTAEQNAAKQQVCQVFDVSVRGQQGQGGVRINGEVNLPLMLRSLNSVVAVQNALTPAVPQDVAAAAQQYIDANLKLTTATTGVTPIEEVNRLNAAANATTFAFADVCGLPR
jgi:hypothetical protein